MHFLLSHSCLFLKHVHTISTYCCNFVIILSIPSLSFNLLHVNLFVTYLIPVLRMFVINSYVVTFARFIIENFDI